jgi:predicted helicase/very-short-patch-repair endonuclease
MPTIKPDSAAIQQYYRILQEAEGQEALHEGNVRAAFENLLRDTARDVKGWSLVNELGERRERNRVEYDGVLRDANRLPHGYWEAKDTQDDLETEIRKKRDKGYRFDNIIFEDTRTAVLFQNGLEVVRRDLHQPEQVADLLNRFYGHEIEPFKKFEEAVAYFQGEIPHIALGLKEKIETAHRDNKKFKTAFDDFMELCRAALNPNLSVAAADEMLIQHMLTERLIRKVFDVEEFTRRNVIAAEIEKVIDSLASQHFNRSDFLGALDRFYTAIEDAADELATFAEKQDFINHVYERFFQGYSIKIADTHGIVYTPQPIVDFMCAAVEEVLQNEFGVKLGDDGVYVIDPCTGTGNFAVNLLRRAHERNPRQFERFYREQLFANEVMLMPYYIASLNIEHAFYELTGHYEPFDGICFVDTLDMAEGPQMRLSFMTEKNTARVERQKAAPITVIIGNPPYNVGQLSENDNNKNRVYEVIDKRVNETYSKDSHASSKSKLNDAYVKFFRWGTDRLQNRNGIVCFVSNNGFIRGMAFDGFRKHLTQDFDAIYHFDFKGNARTSGERRRQEGGNIFSDQIRVGIGITVLVRTNSGDKPKIHYHTVDNYWKAEQKNKYLASFHSLSDVSWLTLQPDNRYTWLVPEHADEYSQFITIGGKETKLTNKPDSEAIFNLYSLGVVTARDNVVFDFNRDTLVERVKQFIENYNAEVDRYMRSSNKLNIDDFVNYDSIKWSRDLKLDLERGNYAEYDGNKVRLSQYRPFCKQHLFYDRILNEETRLFNSIFRANETDNQIICLSGVGHEVFRCLIANHIVEYKFSNPSNGGTQCFPFYVYDADGTNRRENITDWALAQFRGRYGNEPLPKHREGSEAASDSSPMLGGGWEGVTEATQGKGWAVAFSPKDLYDKIKPFARQMRSDMTPAEEHLWQRIRHKRIFDYKFRRQHPIDRFIVDFYCTEARLVIEVDGAIHEYTQEEDALRQAYLESLGLRVLRFTNGDVLQHTDAVVERIGEVLLENEPHPQPLPKHREGSNAESDSSPMHGETHAPDSSPMFGGGREGVNMPGGGTEGVITKWDIFYYVYGLLHHPAYRERYADNLKRELPRIPFAPEFWPFADAGRKLAELHLNYETIEPYQLEWVTTPPVSYRVEKMRLVNPHPAAQSSSPPYVWGGAGGGVVPSYKTYDSLVVNPTLTLQGIPAEAYEYRLGNRSALEWVIDQYQVSEDKRSGIVSDPNGYSDDERYIVDLVERVVQVSVKTAHIVRGLAALPFAESVGT